MRHALSTFALFVGMLMVSVGLVGCDISDLNENPNDSTVPSAQNLLANGQRNIAFETFGDNPTMRGANLLAQYTTQNQYADEAHFALDPRLSFDDIYEALNDLSTAKSLLRQGDAFPEAQNSVAVATIHQVWTFQYLTDIYGSIPFFEALQGRGNPSPVYTPQQEIYPALVDSLNMALDLIDASANGPSGDLIYGGDMAKWQKFANALKMRVGMRMVGPNPSGAQAAVESGAAGAFESNDDNAFFEFLTVSPHRSTIFENRFISGRNDFDASDRFVNALTEQYSLDDPRTPVYFTPSTAADTEYNGFPYGLTPSQAAGLKAQNVDDFFSRSGERFVKADAQQPMLLYDEVLFIRAEAAERGWNVDGSRDQNFEDAIRASIDWWNPDAEGDQVDEYVSAVQDDAASNGFVQVLGEQRWIAHYFQGVQGWSDWRRLDFTGWILEPEGGFAGEAGGQTLVPLRVSYPDREYSVNLSNVQEAATQQFGSVDGDNLGGRLWWDVNPPPAEVQP